MSLADGRLQLGDALSRLRKPESILQWLFALVLGSSVLIPLGFLLLQAFGSTSLVQGIPTTFTTENFVEVFTADLFLKSLGNTFLFVGGAVTVAHIIGFINSYILTKMDIPWAGKFHVLMFLPIFLSPLVLALGFNYSFIPGGIYHSLFTMIGIKPPTITNIWGMILVAGIYQSPYAYAFLSSGIKNINPELEYAAKITGANKATILRRILLPLIKPFLLSSLFLTILLGFQALSSPLILGLPKREYVLATYLLSLQTSAVPPPYGVMAAVGFIMVLLSFLIASGVGRLVGDSKQYTVISGRGTESTTHTTTRMKVLGVGFIAFFLFFGVMIPFLQILIMGIVDGRELSIATLTLDHFSSILNSSLARTAIRNSLLIAVVTATVSVLLTAYVAYVKSRESNLRSIVVSRLAWVPIATPGVVLGLSYLWTYLYIPIGIYGTIFALILAYMVRFLALGSRMNESLLVQQSETLDEQAKICGAGLIERLRKVVFPNMKGGMISVWVLLFTVYVNELSTSIFLYTSNTRVFTVTLYEMWRQAQTNQLAALALIQVSISLSLIAVAVWYFDIDIKIA